MIVEFLKEAAAEFFDAVLWYESKEIGLGKRFRNEVSGVIDSIAANPLLWRERAVRIPPSQLPRVSILCSLFHSSEQNNHRCYRS